MSADFKQVFEKELEEVVKRPGLPPLEDHLTKKGKGSKILVDVLAILHKDGQDKAWEDAVRSAPRKNDAGGSESARNYTGHPGLVGLAFSGGGIRSATFNLGVLQALEKCGLLRSIDYLSTVSGGGYLGSCLSSLFTSGTTREHGWIKEGLGTGWNSLRSLVSKKYVSVKLNAEPQIEATDFPFKHEQGQPESVTLRHLRNNANYLAPKGLLDLLRAPAILLRGVLVNFLVLFPYILLASIVTILINPTPKDLDKSIFGNLMPSSFFLHENTFAGTLTLLFLLVAAYALYPLALGVTRTFDYFGATEWQSRKWTGWLFGCWVVTIVVLAFFEFQPVAIKCFSNAFMVTEANGIDWQDWATMLVTAGSVLASLFAGRLAERISGLGGKLGLYLLGLLGFLLLWLIYLSLCRWAIFSGPTDHAVPGWLKTLVPIGQWLLSYVPEWLLSLVANGTGHDLSIKISAVYAFFALALWLYSLILVDVNSTSLHNLYRDRLSKAYLIRFGKDGGLEPNDTQELSKLNSETGPYHLINAAINLEEPNEAFRRGRKADTFLFSKHFIGSPPTGYCTTVDMESARPHVNLGTAMAVSGAAFAATAGKATIKPLAFLMAMLNVRLNYWLPNPKRVAKFRGWSNTTFNKAGPIYLINELFGRLDADSWNVDISDGGHFENLGVYELLRRECRLIIAGDGECDPELKFEAVSELVRLAQIDMGINIEMKGLDEIRAGKQHHAIGTIRYSGDRKGVLIYLKSSLLKDDALEASLLSEEAYLTSVDRDDDRQYDSNPYIAHYKAKNPSFPHQTTGDQFFDEKQFECYRALGYMVAMRSIGDWKTPIGKKK